MKGMLAAMCVVGLTACTGAHHAEQDATARFKTSCGSTGAASWPGHPSVNLGNCVGLWGFASPENAHEWLAATLSVGDVLTITTTDGRPPPLRSADPSVLATVNSTAGRIEFRATNRGTTSVLADVDMCIDAIAPPCIALNIVVGG